MTTLRHFPKRTIYPTFYMFRNTGLRTLWPNFVNFGDVKEVQISFTKQTITEPKTDCRTLVIQPFREPILFQSFKKEFNANT